MLYKSFLLKFFIVLIFLPVLKCTKDDPNGWCNHIDSKGYYDGKEFGFTSGYYANDENSNNPNDYSATIEMVSNCMQIRSGRIEGTGGVFVTFTLHSNDDLGFITGTYSTENGTDHLGVSNFRIIPEVTPNSSDYEIISANYVEVNWADTGMNTFEVTADLENGKTFICYFNDGLYGGSGPPILGIINQ